MASGSSPTPDPPRDESFAARLKRKYGEGVDPEVSLGGEGVEAPSGATSELLKRLAEHGLKSPRYRLEGEVARGGMGAILRIWDEDLRRHLAMKVVLGKGDAAGSGGTPQLDTKVLARFLEEAQVTGQLDHPGIVPVHELGLDQDGRVYFTMKLVKGRDLKAIFDLVFQEKEGWNETRALGVILKACEAMAYAHKKGVIHRDLKPANIMVGAFGEVFVMDWGLAQVRGRKDAHDIRLAPVPGLSTSSVKTERREEREEAPDSPIVTMDGDVMGTPAYMPPEQARGDVEKLSARSDVYALGAMLYHLLARQMPYVPPGVRVSNRTVLAMALQGPPRGLSEIRRDLPAELVAICEKAMARDPGRRYEDTLALAEDLRAYVEHRVVGAYETGAWAEAKKWVTRNKPLAASIAAGIAVLVLAIVGIAAKNATLAAASATIAAQNESLKRKTAEAEASARRADEKSQEAELQRAAAVHEKEGAEKSAKETKLVADFQTKVLSDISIDEFGHTIIVEQRKDLGERLARLGRKPEDIERTLATLDEILRLSNPTNVAQRVLDEKVFAPVVAKIDKDYGATPLLAAMLLTPLAETLRELGLYERGVLAARSAVDARRASLGNDHPDTLTSINELAELLQARGDLSGAELLLREALVGRRARLGDDHDDTGESINNLGWLLQAQGKLAESEPLLREELARRRAKFGDDHAATLTSLNNLAAVLQAQGKLSEAEPLYRESLAGRRAKFGDDHSETMAVINNLGLLLLDEGKFSEAELLIREVLASRRAKLGDDHPETLVSIDSLAQLLQAQGKLSEAEPLYRESLAGRRAKLGDGNPDTLTTINNLASLQVELGKFSEAEPLFREVLAGRRAKLGDRHLNTLLSINNLAVVLRAQGKPSEAEPLFREAVEGYRAEFGDDHPDTLTSLNGLAALLRDQGKLSDAEPLFREALASGRAKLGSEHPITLSSMDGLASVLSAQGKYAEAEPLSRDAVAGRRAKLGDDHPHTLNSIDKLASLLQAQGKLSESELLFREVLAGRRSKLGDDHSSTLTSIEHLAVLLQAQGKLSEAEPLSREAVEGCRAKFGNIHPSTLGAIDNLGGVLRAQGKFSEAESLCQEALSELRIKNGDGQADTQRMFEALISLYEQWHHVAPQAGHDKQAADLRRLLKSPSPPTQRASGG
jgi:serine/threonine protein kinase